MVNEIDKLIQKNRDSQHDDMFMSVPHPSGKVVRYQKKAIFPRPPHLVANN